MVKSTSAIVEIHGNKKTKQIVRGCPQGGILSPFLWNLVVDSLLNYTKNSILCDIQGFANNLSLKATLKSLSSCKKASIPKMWPTASGATQETKYKNVKISLPSTKQEREKRQNNLRVF